MCLAYFQGSGYSEGFTKHMGEMLEIFEKDVPVRLTVATDEICSACPNNQEGSCIELNLVKRYDEAVLSKCGLTEGMELGFFEFTKTVQEKIIASGLRSEICGECQWDDICRNKKSRWEEK
jgi:hypothetical protein